MAVTIRQTEGQPEGYPTPSVVPEGIDADMIWQRIEAYVSHRWTARDVSWIVEGQGEWEPPLAPATIATVEVWDDGDWTVAEVSPSPLGGYVFHGCGPYRVTGTVGGGEAPAAVLEAFRRLAAYFAQDEMIASALTSTATQVGEVRIEKQMAANSAGKALQYSGAGDLLRPYRRVR